MKYTIKVQATDNAKRNRTATNTTDTPIIAGSETLTVSFDNATSQDWVQSTFATITSSGEAQSGCYIQYKLDEKDWTRYNNGDHISIGWSGEKVKARWFDGINVGTETAEVVSVRVDDKDPTAEITATSSTTKSISVAARSSDESLHVNTQSASQVKLTQFSCSSTNQDNWTTVTNGTHVFDNLTQGTQYTVKVKVTDNANRTTTKQTTVSTGKINDGNILTISFDNENGKAWCAETKARISGSQSNCHVEYKLDDKNWTDYNANEAIPIDHSGQKVKARLSDGHNNGQESKEVTSDKVDDNNPTVSIQRVDHTTKSITVTVNGNDTPKHTGTNSASGINTYTYTCTPSGGTPLTFTGNVTSHTFDNLSYNNGNNYTVKVQATDNAKRTSLEATDTAKLDKITALSRKYNILGESSRRAVEQ